MSPDKIVFKIPPAYSNVDRYFKWLPAVAMIGSRKLGLRTAHPTHYQLGLLALTTLLSNAATTGLKHAVHRPRPLFPLDGRSFPSSHTAMAIAGAELFRRELYTEYPVAAWSGYIPAAATAALRLTKRRHWPSDVVAGGFIGFGAVWLARMIMRKAATNRKATGKHDLSETDIERTQ